MTGFVYADALLKYRFSDTHPFNQMRLLLTKELLESYTILNQEQIINPRYATDEELQLIHQPDYIEAVKKASTDDLSEDMCQKYGLNTTDTPNFKGMHDACRLIVGGTLAAVDAVMQGKMDTCVHFGGGLHHGFSGRASGFCIYNDSAIACKYLAAKYKQKVMYIDTDAHHGDGVQFAFYNDSDVFTYSIHETGRYLFPGTGGINERGDGEGYLYTMNLPIDAYTEDDNFLEIFETSIQQACEFFKPDIIFSVHGADAHFLDPLTHLSCTHETFKRIPEIILKLSQQYTNQKWIAVGGGGYNVFQVAPFVFAQVYAVMQTGKALNGTIPQTFRDKWQPKSEIKLPETFESDIEEYEAIPRRMDITEKNETMMERVLRHYK